MTDLPDGVIAEDDTFHGAGTPIGRRTEGSSVATMRRAIAAAGEVLRRTIDSHPLVEPAVGADRLTTITVSPASCPVVGRAAPAVTDWRPAAVFSYRSIDPWQQLNPQRSAAIANLIAVGIEHAHIGHREHDGGLAYDDTDAGRSRYGTRATALTQAVIDIDPGMGDWIKGLPRAEGLRPVASPWSDVGLVTCRPDGSFSEVPVSPAMLALAGGSRDGRGVRERAAWESWMLVRLQHVLRRLVERDGSLSLTSLGTGTGEPIMDTGLQVVQQIFGGADRMVQVHGFDLDSDSLAVAGYLARQKTEAADGRLLFEPAVVNVLDRQLLAASVAGSRPHVVEAIGLAEYIASEVPASPGEARQRAGAQRAGRLSAEGFFGTVYGAMPVGAVLLTGNMRSDSPDARFVIDGLGWPGIIPRTTEGFLAILQRAGIPGPAVELFIPEAGTSSGVYNLAAITRR